MLLTTLVLLLLQDKPPAEERFTLENGLEVVLKSADRVDVATVAIGYRAGVMNEPAERHGVAHLVEHLVFRGATKSFKAGEAEKALIAAGPFNIPFVDANAETLHDFTYFYSICPSAKLEQALQIEAERMRTCEFTDSLLDAERLRALEEVAVVAKSPAAVAYHKAQELTYANLRYRLPKVGSEEGMKAVRLDDAKAFYDAWYRPNNAVLIVYGKFDTATLKAAIQKHFGACGRKELPKLEVPEEAEPKGRRAEIAGPQRQLTMTWLSAPNGTKEKAGLLLAIYALLRSSGAIRKQATEMLFFDDPFRSGRSMITFTAAFQEGADPEAVAAAAQAWLDGFTLDAKKLEEARSNLRNDLMSNDLFQLGFMQRTKEKEYAQALAQIAINRMRVEAAGSGRVAGLLKLADELSADDVVAAARKYLSKERANLVIVK